jgi:cytochrome c553
MVRPHLVSCLLVLASLAAAASAQADAPALFAANCAKCHGLDGSGTGPTVLDRPARNFKEGGFSFGNTPEIIARTIAHGIPGSPMPTFEGALSDAQIQALAAYVVTLGPPVKEVSEAETLMHVTDRPLVVRGILPPLEEGGKKIPRGLLIGTPDGLTFEYAADDVRLLAVRLGDFVKRTDWGDRGGSPLEPLGQVVWSDSNVAGPWSLAGSASAVAQGSPAGGGPLWARLLSTTTSSRAAVSYALVETGEAMRAFATVTEVPGAAALGEHAGFSRDFRVSRIGPPDKDQTPTLELRLGGWTEVLSRDRICQRAGRGPCMEQWWMRTVAYNVGELLLVSRPLGYGNVLDLSATPSGLTGRLPLGHIVPFDAISSSEDVLFELESFVLSPWTPEEIADLRKEVEQ